MFTALYSDLIYLRYVGRTEFIQIHSTDLGSQAFPSMLPKIKLLTDLIYIFVDL